METTVIINYYHPDFLLWLNRRGFMARRHDEHSIEVTCTSPRELERLAQYLQQYE